MSKSPSNIFDFVAQLKFYAAYHHNVINKWIHIVCVPQILWTSMVFLAYVGPLVTIDSIPKYIEINIPLILVLLTSIYFIILNTIAGTTYSILLVVMWYTATLFYHTPDAWKIALFLNVASWIAQFIGHGVFEGRKPTLLDNLFQALLLAPFFCMGRNIVYFRLEC